MYIKRCSLVVVIQLLQAARASPAKLFPRSSSWQHQSDILQVPQEEGWRVPSL